MTPKKSDLEEVIIRVDETLKGPGGVLDRLIILDDTIKSLDEKLDSTIAKLEHVDQIAREARETADNAQKKINQLSSKFWLVVGILAGSGILSAGLASLIQSVS